MTKLAITTDDIVKQLRAKYGDEIVTAQVTEWSEENGYNTQTISNRLKDYKVARGTFSLSGAQAVQKLNEQFNAPAVEPVDVNVPETVQGEVKTMTREYQTLVPTKDPEFVPFGNFTDIKKIISSGIFYPLFITGLSGNGKTHGVEQACAQLKRDLVRVNITIESDEDDLIGGFRLIGGETVWNDGPVIEAMKRGAILLLDEIDLASNKIMCLQSILEGKGVYLKKTNQWVTPADGFNIIATANTKGKGSETGMFIGTNVLNEAFLERFAVTFEQSYPLSSVETRILNKKCAGLQLTDYEQYTMHLTTWASIIRKTYDEGGVEDVISTRRLIAIVKAYAIWNDMAKAIRVCVNRFDDDTKRTFISLFEKVSGEDTSEESEAVTA